MVRLITRSYHETGHMKLTLTNFESRFRQRTFFSHGHCLKKTYTAKFLTAFFRVSSKVNLSSIKVPGINIWILNFCSQIGFYLLCLYTLENSKTGKFYLKHAFRLDFTKDKNCGTCSNWKTTPIFHYKKI